MKKRFFCMSLILVMLLSVSAHAIQSRSITSVPHLSFDGNNASCGTPVWQRFDRKLERKRIWHFEDDKKCGSQKRKNLYHGCQFFCEWNKAVPSYYQCHKWLKDE